MDADASAPPRRRVIPAAIWDARLEARRIVDEAAGRAADLVRAADAEAASIRACAAAAGREEGLATVTELLARAAVERDRRLARSEAELVDLAFEAAARVLADAVARDPQAAMETARRAVEAAGARRELTLRVHPSDLAPLRDSEPRLLQAAQRARRIAIVADDAVERGGAVVETEVGTIDARLAAQLAGLRRALERP